MSENLITLVMLLLLVLGLWKAIALAIDLLIWLLGFAEWRERHK